MLEGVDEAAIWEAARLANALEFIQNHLMVLKPNWESRESGYLNVSVIARALLRNRHFNLG